MKKLVICFLILAAACLAVPTEITIQGRLSEDIGTPYDGEYVTSFYLYDVETGGVSIWREEQEVTYTNGLFHVYLGSVTPLTIDVFDGTPKYLSMSIDGDEINPRRKLVSVPYAFYAENTNFDTLGAYLDTTFAGEVTHIDSVSYISFISNIDSITYIDSISIIDSIGFIDFIDYIDSISFVDSIGWIGYTVHADTAWHVYWDSIIGMPEDFGDDDDWEIAGTDMYALVSGNVGIGISLPASTNRLHVRGNGAIGEKAVFGKAVSGPEGWLGSQLYGVYGNFNSTNFGYLGAIGYGVYARGDLHAGYFEGDITVTGDANLDGDIIVPDGSKFFIDGDCGSDDVLMADATGNLFWADGLAGGDNWGAQSAETDATIDGDGVPGTPLKIARQSAATGQVLKWNGTTWSPADDASGSGGDNWGSQIAQTDATIDGDGLSATPLKLARQSAATGQVLKWNGTTWAPADDVYGSGGDGWGGEVVNTTTRLLGDGTTGSPLDIAQNGAGTGQFLRWSGSAWLPGDETGDDWGSETAHTTSRIDGNGTSASPLDIARQGATTGQVLKWNGSTWYPADDIDGDDWGSDAVNTTTRLTGNGTSGSPLDIARNGASTGQVLSWNGSSWVPADAATGSGDITAVIAGTGLSGGGTSGDVTLTFNSTWGDTRYVNEGQTNSITSAMITDGTITSSDIHDGATLTEISDDDGSGSGLDADLLDGMDSSDFAEFLHNHCGQRWECDSDSGLYLESDYGYGFWGTTIDSAYAGVRGDGGDLSAGILGTSSFSGAAGVMGISDETDGVYGYTDGYLDAGVVGVEPNDTIGYGVLGVTGGRGAGVLGLAAGYRGSWWHAANIGLSNSIAGEFIADTTQYAWGIFAQTSSNSGTAIRARSLANTNYGYNYAIHASCSTGFNVNVSDSFLAIGYAVRAENFDDRGVAIFAAKGDMETYTVRDSGAAIIANADDVAIYGFSARHGVMGVGDNLVGSVGVYGESEADTGTGVFGCDSDLGRFTINDGVGVIGYSDNVGVFGRGDATSGSIGVEGDSDNETDGIGVGGFSSTGVYGRGVSDLAANTGVYAMANDYGSGVDAGMVADCENEAADFAGYVFGDLHIAGTLSKTTGSFLIDHPDDPQHKVLRHNFVESPENLCMYRGKAILDDAGEAVVDMPDYFKSLTKEDEATVTLTCLGRPFLAGYEWQQDFLSFTVYGEPGREISYIVLADRDDPAMRKLRRSVVDTKGSPTCKIPAGKMLNPDVYGFDSSASVVQRRDVQSATEPQIDGQNTNSHSSIPKALLDSDSKLRDSEVADLPDKGIK